MFPTFISILDIQSWWEVPSIAHFCSLFRSAFNLLDFDIEDLEEALLTDGTEETSWLQELIVRLLTGCLPNNEISTFNYQMFLRRLFREKCKEHDRYNPFNTDIDFQLLPLRTKVDILHALCDFRLDAEDVLEQLKNLEADSLRVEPLGYDDNESAYWYFYGTRLYREDFNAKNNKKGKSVWQVVCFTEADWFQLAKKFKKSQSKSERQLYRTLTENFLPELPRLFHEKERLARKRLLENQPRRTSSRLGIKRQQEQEAEQAEQAKLAKDKEKDPAFDETDKKKELERRRQEAYERRARLREQSHGDEDKANETSATSRYEMAGNKKRDKKPKTKQRQSSSGSGSSRDRGRSSSRTETRKPKTGSESTATASSGATTTVGRQTNNSLASATGQIVIQPILNPHRKKLKTSQVFRQTDEDLQTGMHKILDCVKNHEDAWPFIEPVEEEHAPNYYSIIRKPMDLQRMEERLESGYYKSFSRFRGDFQLIVDNCRLYNGVDNEYTEMVGNLLVVFEKSTDRYLDEITSSDDEITVEYRDSERDDKQKKITSINLGRKPTLAARTDKKREPSVQSEASNSTDPFEKTTTTKSAVMGTETEKTRKKNKNNNINKRKATKNNNNNRKQTSPVRSRSPSKNRSLSSSRWSNCSSPPPPSWSPSSPDSGKCKTTTKAGARTSYTNHHEEPKGRTKCKDPPNDKKHPKNKEASPSPPKQKDKHNKLRETIEKLKAKSEISKKLKDKDHQDSENDKTKENRKSYGANRKRGDCHKVKLKHKTKKGSSREFEDENSTTESVQSEHKKPPVVATNTNKKSGSTVKNSAAIEALTLATEQTLKDINKWLDDTPRLSEFSSASNSPSHYIGAEEFDGVGTKIEQDYRKRLEKPPLTKKDATTTATTTTTRGDMKRRMFHRDPAKFLKKREVQRTIDRLQPGKSKGNLLSNLQTTNKVDELFPLGPLSKIKDTRNALIVKTNESTPKLSLGSVLDSFGKHKFVDDVKKDEEEAAEKGASLQSEITAVNVAKKETKDESTKNDVIVDESEVRKEDEKMKTEPQTSSSSLSGPGKATPNLSAWFKAFGAPKVPPNQKKSETKPDLKVEVEETKQKVAVPDVSPNPDSPATPQSQPAPRQRKMSTGSTVSERSSFSQDMDSPRIGIDERLGAYPAPYPSPLHRSPSSGASPVMAASPRPDVSPKSAYPTVNGQIRVGFYQDTVSNKSSPDKSCSPRENPQSPYPQYASEHVYTPTTTSASTTDNPTPNYSAYNSNPSNYYYSNPAGAALTTTYTGSPSYYDTSKPLTDQYQAKTNPAPGYHSPGNDFQGVHSPNYHGAGNSPGGLVQSPAQPQQTQQQQQQQQLQPQQMSTNYQETYRQQPRIADNNKQPQPQQQQTPAMFPVKKRVYNNEPDLVEQQNLYDRNYELSLLSGRQLNISGGGANQQQQQQPQQQQQDGGVRSNTPHQTQYVHQNIPNPRSLPQNPNNSNMNTYPGAPTSNLYGYNNTDPSGYTLNMIPERPLDLNARPEPVDKSKYANMGGYVVGGASAELGFNRGGNPPQYNYGGGPGRSSSVVVANKPSELQQQNADMMMRTYNNKQSQPEMSIPRPSYVTTTTVPPPPTMENLTNLSHIVDRFSTAENMYYSEKGLTPSHVYSGGAGGGVGGLKPGASTLPMFGGGQSAYGHEMQPSQAAMYTQLPKVTGFSQQQQPQQPPAPQQQQEKKSKRRKSAKTTTTTSSIVPDSVAPTSNQGFQSYTGLKNAPPTTASTSTTMEPSAISLKTASVVPGSAFNFGPAPPGPPLGLYSDKDTYQNFLDDYRTAPNYYMAAAAAAAHHRSTPEGADKQQARTVHHQPGGGGGGGAGTAAAGYAFLGAPQPRPPSYHPPLSGAFMSPHHHQAPPLMDAGSPLYQQYLQAGVLHQGLLGPPGAYPPGYHPALSMRQPFDSMTPRPSWL